MTVSDLEPFTPDGHYLPIIKPHSIEKLKLHNYYAALFAGGMRRQWPNLVYVGFYAGAGAATIEDTGRKVKTSALSVLTQKVPFDRYIFVDVDPQCISALEFRVSALGLSKRTTIINSEVNDSIPRVLSGIPDYRQEGGVLTFCFIDPFRIDLDFRVIRGLSHLKIDILLMVPLGFDVRRNWRVYVEKPQMRGRLTRFLGDSSWVESWAEAGRPYTEFPRLIQQRMTVAMQGLGFMQQDSRDIKDVKVASKNVYLYSLHLFSKNEAGRSFWRKSLTGTSEQHSLGL